MAVSNTISATTFNTNRVVDTAFRRCRLKAQAITAEMQQYARDALYLLLSGLANTKTPSWCIERQIYPFYQGQPVVSLDLGTVEVLNANYRTLQELTGTTVSSTTEYKVDFATAETTASTVNTVGVKWAGAAVDLTFQVSDDDAIWITVGTQTTTAASGEWTWTDITPALAYQYFRITSATPRLASQIYLGCLPQEIPMGLLNRDTYVAQSNKVFEGRPLTYWFQRDRIHPKINLWPAPNDAAEQCQLIIWRHRHIMDVGTLRQDVEVPQRWMEAITAGLASKVAAETPEVDIQLIPILDQKAAIALNEAWEGDNDGSPIIIQPGISPYTR